MLTAVAGLLQHQTGNHWIPAWAEKVVPTIVAAWCLLGGRGLLLSALALKLVVERGFHTSANCPIKKLGIQRNSAPLNSPPLWTISHLPFPHPGIPPIHILTHTFSLLHQSVVYRDCGPVVNRRSASRAHNATGRDLVVRISGMPYRMFVTLICSHGRVLGLSPYSRQWSTF